MTLQGAEGLTESHGNDLPIPYLTLPYHQHVPSQLLEPCSIGLIAHPILLQHRAQYSGLERGGLRLSGQSWRCQKQLCTKITKRCRGSTMSGLPGSL